MTSSYLQAYTITLIIHLMWYFMKDFFINVPYIYKYILTSIHTIFLDFVGYCAAKHRNGLPNCKHIPEYGSSEPNDVWNMKRDRRNRIEAIVLTGTGDLQEYRRRISNA